MSAVASVEDTLLLASPQFLASLYAQFTNDPASVDASVAAYFRGLGDAESQFSPEIRRASWAAKSTTAFGGENDVPLPTPANDRNAAKKGSAPQAVAGGEFTAEQVQQLRQDSIRALMLIRAYRVRGHLLADLDPLGLTEIQPHPELDYKSYGFTENDLDRRIFIDNVLGLASPTLRQIVERLQQTYSRRIGVEFMHIQDPDAKSWLQEKVENSNYTTLFSKEQKTTILKNLTKAELLEKFLHLKFVGTKRFGLDGGESTIASLEAIIDRAGENGVRDICFGMAHRGRLNVLTNVLGKSFTALFSEFQGTPANPEDVQGSGDVKYHLGTSIDREYEGYNVHLSLAPNPSHLEAVDPVVIGKVRAKQDQRKDTERRQVMGVLLHGDAAFAGQGLVAETFGLSDLKGYKTGGTIHVITNNQIGFTTSPAYARSSPYCTDVARIVQAPIFHVNGDDPEAVVWVSQLAADYRQQFQKDVVLDIICYRRFGHNESDEPAFTQPKMYKAIAAKATTRTQYADKLVQEAVLTQAEADSIVSTMQTHLEQSFEAAKSYKPNKADWLEGAWSGYAPASGDDRKGNTAVSLELLKQVGDALCRVPETFDLNSKIQRQLELKKKAFDTGEGIDWATAEALAFGTLLAEGNPVRLSGQDCGRGTFSQRHAVLRDQTNEQNYMPLNNLWSGQPAFAEVLDSPLAEASVLGFDYGYSGADPKTLVCWEGQFGDFVNGAQVIIDQFISSAESKWLRMSGLVLLLPHGYEGQGPEHSSARLERFLQLCAEDNMQVANCSTPANYFHILRRQLRRNFRKPLILMTPKSLLRHKLCVSQLSEMAENTSFHRVLPEIDKLVDDSKIKRVVLCSGKVYYDLLEARRAAKLDTTALVRLEQFYPFPHNSLVAQLSRYKNAEVIWCQEEPQNMGAWTFVDRRIEGVLTAIKHKSARPVYAGRVEAASPATGSYKRHEIEQAALVKQALWG